MRFVMSVMLLGLVAASPVAYAEDERPVEYSLAIIQTGGYIAPDAPLVFRYGAVLDRLGERCQESRSQLGGIALRLSDYLREQGVYTATPLSLLQGTDNATPPDLFGPDHLANCSEVLALVATLVFAGE